MARRATGPWLQRAIRRRAPAGTVPGMDTHTFALDVTVTPPPRRAPRLLAALLALSSAACAVVSLSALALASPPAQAAGPQQRKLEITVEGTRQAPLVPGTERGRGRLQQQLVVSVLLATDGTPMVQNPLDPDDARRQLERGQRTQAKVQAALDRQAQRPAPATAAPDAAAMQARAQQMMARCGQDRECLMREASAFSSTQVAGGDARLQGRMQAYGDAAAACQRQPAGAKRDACVAQARRDAGAPDDETDTDDEVETPYLLFTGRTNCRFDAAVKVDERIDGQFDDVQGVVPFTHTVQADARQRDEMVCPLVQAVLDTRNGRWWTNVPLAVREFPATTVRSEKGRAPRRNEGTSSLQWREADGWLQQRLQNLNDAGSANAVLPAGPAGQGGTFEMRVRWRFAPA